MSTPDPFLPCVAFTKSEEGGFSDDPRDLGRATNFGITQATLAHWRGEPVSTEQVRALTWDEAVQIYRALYWNTLRCWGLWPGLDLMIFDHGVNTGVYGTARVLQALLGVQTDGVVGPFTTLAARSLEDRGDFLNRLEVAQAQDYRAKRNFPTFGEAWLARLQRRSVAARRLAGIVVAA